MKKALLFIFTLITFSLSIQSQNVYIPDANFKAYLLGRTDINRDNDNLNISYNEASSLFSTLDVGSKSIASLEGIEAFVNLTYLVCGANQLTTLDISNNRALLYLDCSENQLTTLDVYFRTSLTTLDCSNNQLTSLDISNNKALLELRCSKNKLSNLDISKNTSLTSISCSNNQLTSLDLKNIANLQYLFCESNQLINLDLTNNTSLIGLDCTLNKLLHLDLSTNTKLNHLFCYFNQISTLNVSKNTSLSWLECHNNLLTTLDVRENKAIQYFACFSNPYLNCISALNSQFKNAWHKDDFTSYSEMCTNTVGDFAQNPTPLILNSIISTSVSDFVRGRNSISNCKTALDSNNVVDTYYSFVSNNDSISIDILLDDATWLSSIELIDTLTYTSIPNTCQSNVANNQSQRTYILTSLTPGQKYLARLEIGSTTPLGHARKDVINNTFSVQIQSSITSIENISTIASKSLLAIYNLLSYEVSNTYKGLVIYKFSDGTTQKVMQE